MSEDGSGHGLRRIMVDIETVGLEIGAAVVELGAVRFEPGAVLDERFYSSINLGSAQDAGLTIDGETLEWWLDANPDIATEVLVGGDDLDTALASFVDWYDGIEPHEVWANSPAFDCEMLEHAGDAVGVPMPWEYYQERDLRTLDALPHSVDIEQGGTEHTALDDAVYQARAASAILAELAEQSGATATGHAEVDGDV